MAAKRILLGVVWAGLCGASALGQATPTQPPPSSGGSGTNPYLAPPAAPGVGALPPPPAPSPTAVLTAPPGQPALPPGSVASPWCGGSPAGAGCCGPVGGNGPLTYELYMRTGPNFVIGGSPEFSAALRWGWQVAGGGRTLLMNQAGDAAWVLDAGLGYSFTQGDANALLFVATPPALNQQTGLPSGPDQINAFRVDELHRTWFSYAIGRDWWLNGPGYLPAECGWNSRAGVDVGGRWGTARVNLIPFENPDQYLRRSGIAHSVFVGLNWNCEVPMGAWVLFAGARLEWGYTWTNIIPPEDGDIQDLNVLFNVGVRF